MAEAHDRKEVEGVYLTYEQIEDLGLVCSFLRSSKRGMHGKSVDNLFSSMPKDFQERMKVYVSDYRGIQEDYLYNSCFRDGKFDPQAAANKLLHISIQCGNIDEFSFLVESSIAKGVFVEVIGFLKSKGKLHRLRGDYRERLAIIIYNKMIEDEKAFKFAKSSYFAPKERALLAKSLMRDGRYELAYEFSDSGAKNLQLMFAKNAPIEFLPMLIGSKHKEVIDMIEKRFDRGF